MRWCGADAPSDADRFSRQDLSDEVGTLILRASTYTWNGDVLARTTFYSSDGAIANYVTYDFDAGRKLSSYRYSSTDVYLGRTDFAYDAVTHLRTGSTSYDPNDVVTGICTRTYGAGLFLEAEIVDGATTMHRSFTYERGPRAGDPDVFLEF